MPPRNSSITIGALEPVSRRDCVSASAWRPAESPAAMVINTFCRDAAGGAGGGFTGAGGGGEGFTGAGGGGDGFTGAGVDGGVPAGVDGGVRPGVDAGVGGAGAAGS